MVSLQRWENSNRRWSKDWSHRTTGNYGSSRCCELGGLDYDLICIARNADKAAEVLGAMAKVQWLIYQTINQWIARIVKSTACSW